MTNDKFREILKEAKRGDEDAFRKLISLYWPLIYTNSFIGEQYNEDLNQEILFAIFRQLRKFPMK